MALEGVDFRGVLTCGWWMGPEPLRLDQVVFRGQLALLEVAYYSAHFWRLANSLFFGRSLPTPSSSDGAFRV